MFAVFKKWHLIQLRGEEFYLWQKILKRQVTTKELESFKARKLKGDELLRCRALERDFHPPCFKCEVRTCYICKVDFCLAACRSEGSVVQ
jgi:hypothetical protein